MEQKQPPYATPTALFLGALGILVFLIAVYFLFFNSPPRQPANPAKQQFMISQPPDQQRGEEEELNSLDLTVPEDDIREIENEAQSL